MNNENLQQTIVEHITENADIQKAFPFSKYCSSISKVYPPIDLSKELPKPSGDLKIVHISLDKKCVKKPLKVYLNKIEKDECIRKLLHIEPECRANYLTQYKKALDIAVRFKPHIICVNELGFPEESLKPSTEATKYTCEIATKHKALILAGSYHDSDTFYNTGLIFYPRCKSECDPECNSKYDQYFKCIPAHGIGELVNVPAERQTPIIKAFGIEICPIICLDFLDFSTVASIVKEHTASNGFRRFIMVQSYTKHDDMMRIMAEYISTIISGVVSWVNIGRGGFLKSIMYNCGEAEKEKKVKLLPNDSGIINLYKIDLRELDRAARDNDSKITHRDKWTFGQTIAATPAN